MAPLLKPDALVTSLQHGVDNAAALACHLTQAVVPLAVHVATAMPGPGEIHHHGRGDLMIGTPAGHTMDLDALVKLIDVNHSAR